MRQLAILLLIPVLAWGQRPSTDYPVLKYDPSTGGFVPSVTNGHAIGNGITDGDKGDISITSGVWNVDTGALAIGDTSGLQTALDLKLDDSQASAFALTLMDDANAAAARTTLGFTGSGAVLAIGDTNGLQTALNSKLSVLGTGKTLWVDTTNGNNTTAVSAGNYDASKPFLTVAAAITAAASGDTIEILPGSYEGANIGKNGVSIHLHGNAILTLPETAAAGDYLFNDSGAATVMRIYGAGTVQASMSGFPDSTGIVKMTHASSRFTVNVRHIESRASAELDQPYVFRATAGELLVRADSIVAAGNSNMAGPRGTSKMWIYADTITGESEIISAYGSAELYVGAREVIGTYPAEIVSAYETSAITVDVRKLTNTAEIATTSTGGSIKFINVNMIGANSNNGFGLVNASTTGAVEFYDCRLENTDGTSGSTALVDNGSGAVTLYNTVLISGGTNSIVSATPRTVTAYNTSANKPIHANVTVAGSGVSVNGAIPSNFLGSTATTAAAGNHAHAIGVITGLGTNVATLLGAFTSANLATALTNETGTGAAVFGTSPVIVTPTISTVASAAGADFNANSTAAAAITTAQAGQAAKMTASNAVAGSSTVGAAAGGSVTITSGNAARLTSGNANGGDINLVPGTGIGTGVTGKTVVSSLVTADAATNSYGQLELIDTATPTMRLSLGYNNSSGNGWGFIQALKNAAAYTPLRLQPSGSYVAIGSTAAGNAGDLVLGGKLNVAATNTTAGTTGAQTINKGSGTVNLAASATSLVVTNSLVTTSSLVFLTVRTNDANAFSVRAVPASGSFTIHVVGTAPAAETSVGFMVVN